jgi:Flp pilus assembly protein TadB
MVARRRGPVAAAAVGLAGGLLTGWPVAGLAAGLAVAAVPRLLSGQATRTQVARLEALETWTRRVADLLGSGAGGLEQAIASSVRTCPAPIAGEVAALSGRLRTLGAEAALRAFADDLADIGSPAADIVAAALILRVRRGGRGLRPVLEALAADVAELVRARRAVEADRAKPRANVRALIGITAAVLTATLLFAREYLAPFGTGGGQVMLAAIAAVFAAGVWLMARITRLPPTPRFLPAVSTSDTTAGRGSWWG